MCLGRVEGLRVGRCLGVVRRAHVPPSSCSHHGPWHVAGFASWLVAASANNVTVDSSFGLESQVDLLASTSCGYWILVEWSSCTHIH